MRIHFHRARLSAADVFERCRTTAPLSWRYGTVAHIDHSRQQQRPMADVLLIDYLRAWSRQPFDWRRHNCGHFVAGWVQELTGRQVAGDLLGRFASAVACHRVLRRAGYRDLVALATHRLASLARPVASHEPGDVVVVNLKPGGPAFALSLGR